RQCGSERVEAVGSVQAHPGHALLDLDPQRLELRPIAHARLPTQVTAAVATSSSTSARLRPLALSGLKPWSAVSSQHHVTRPLIFRAECSRSGFLASESRVPLTNSTGIVSREKCSSRR